MTRLPPLTDPGTAVGTVAYMSPEQLRGEPLDARSDLFSFGLVLYEMATGRPAFAGATSAVLSAAILHASPRAPREIRPELPAALDQVILKALEKDRDVRCQTASELRADLKRLKRDLDAQPTPAVATPTPGAASLAPDPVPATAAPASSDTQLAVALVRRHRALAAGFLVAVFAVGTAVLVGTRWRVLSPPASPAASIEHLQVTALTSTGNAESPAISPDGKARRVRPA